MLRSTVSRIASWLVWLANIAAAFAFAECPAPSVAQTVNAPAQTPYGTARGYIAVGVSTTDVGLNTAANAFSANRAFIEFAGITGGLSESFYDFYSTPASQYQGLYVPAFEQDILSATFSAGSALGITPSKTYLAGSDFTPDTLTEPDASANPSGTSFVTGFGFQLPIGAYAGIFSEQDARSISGVNLISRYAPENRPASGFPAVLPTKAPPKPAPLPPHITFGVEGNVYVFAGGNSTINGIPGGPGVTATGSDSFNFRDRVLLTAGGWVALPIAATWRVALTGGFAEADKSAKYNCVTYCILGAPTPTFTDAKDVWMPGAYVGGRIETLLAIAAWPGATLGFDYKHVFLGSENVTFGNIATRTVTLNTSGSIDMFMARLTLPLRTR